MDRKYWTFKFRTKLYFRTDEISVQTFHEKLLQYRVRPSVRLMYLERPVFTNAFHASLIPKELKNCYVFTYCSWYNNWFILFWIGTFSDQKTLQTRETVSIRNIISENYCSLPHSSINNATRWVNYWKRQIEANCKRMANPWQTKMAAKVDGLGRAKEKESKKEEVEDESSDRYV